MAQVCILMGGGGGANVQLCQSIRGQMSLHSILGKGANVRH